MKKLIPFLTALVFCLNTIAFAQDEVPSSEPQKIEYSLNYIIERFYKGRSIECVPLDISAQANMGFADETAGDGKGGWTDQGSKNDMSSFNLFGKQTFLGATFNIINPLDNGGKSCIILRGQNNEAFPLSAEVPVNDTAYGMYVLHSTAYGSGDKAGSYYFIYEDGTSSYYDIYGNMHIKDFWGTLNNNYTRVVWKGSNESSKNITLNIFALNNPHPEKKIKSIKFVSDGEGQYINIVGVTLAKEVPIFPMMEGAAASDSGLIKYGTDSWAVYDEPDEKSAAGTPLDMSSYLDAPAGKHGALIADGENLVFADGTRAKFWGTNIVGEACFPDYETAEKIASRAARSGYNLIRFVNIDEKPLDSERLDRLGYFIKLLNDKGIYTYFSLLGNAPGDGEQICDGWKIDGIFRDDLIEKQTEFVKELFTYKNKYTGVSIGEDSSVVMVDMADQNTMFDYQYGLSCFNVTDEKSKAELQKKFNEYLKAVYKSTSKLKKSWGDLLESESIEKGTVKINGNWRYGIFDSTRKRDVQKFFAYIQSEYVKTVEGALRNAGYKGLITGFTNTWNNLMQINNEVNSDTDFVPANMMFSMGIDRTEKWPYLIKLKDNLIYVDTDSTVTSDGHDGKSLINLVKTRPVGKPFVITEWGAANFSKQYIENSLVMAALSAQQNWTPIQYCFIQDEINSDKIADAYSTYSNPVTLGMSYASAALYYSMDELGTKKTVNQNKADMYGGKINDLTLSDYLSSKTSTAVTDRDSDMHKARNDEFVIDNGSVYWDMLDGVFFAQTDNVLAFAGNTPNAQKRGFAEFEIYDSWSALSFVSLDGSRLENSGHILLSLGSDVTNKGTVYTTKYVIGKIGNGGAVYKPVSGRFTLNLDGMYDVYSLTSDGLRDKKLPAEYDENGKITFYTGSVADKAINYEIVRRQE